MRRDAGPGVVRDFSQPEFRGGQLASAPRVGGESSSSTRGGGMARLLRRAGRGPGPGSSSPAPATADVSDAFICYSRRDREFVERLHAALVAAGKEVYVDWEDIPTLVARLRGRALQRDRRCRHVPDRAEPGLARLAELRARDRPGGGAGQAAEAAQPARRGRDSRPRRAAEAAVDRLHAGCGVRRRGPQSSCRR